MTTSGPRFDEQRKVWTQRVRVRLADGTVRQVRVSAATKKACREKVARLDTAAADRTYRPPSTQTVAEYLGGWLDIVAGVKASTRDNYRRGMTRYVLPRIGHVRLDQLDVGRLDRLYVELAATGLSPSTIRNQVHAPLRKALNDALRKGHIPRNPALTATPPSAVERRLRMWGGPELDAFLCAEEGGRHHAVWMVLATTGCRRGEALGLRWSDVDLDGASATIRQQVTSVGHEVVIADGTKTGTGRAVGLDARTVDVLRCARRTQAAERLAMGSGYRDHDLCFAKPDGTPMHPEYVYRQFKRRSAALGLPDIPLHGLRHTWATLALEAGLDVKIVSNRLGHSSTTVTQNIYQHVSVASDTAAAELVAGLIFGGRSAQYVPNQQGG